MGCSMHCPVLYSLPPFFYAAYVRSIVFHLNLYICCTEYARRIFYSFDVAYARSIANIFSIGYYFLLPSMPPMRYYVCLVCRRCGIISLMSLVVCSMHVCCRCSIHFTNFTCIRLVNVSRSMLCASTLTTTQKPKTTN